MIAYLSGKIVLVLENQIIVKIPSGVGYLVNISGEFLVNENVELFIWQNGADCWGFYSWSDRNWAENLTLLGVEINISCNLVWQNGEKKLSQEAIYGNGEIFEKAGINSKIIGKIIRNKPKIEQKTQTETEKNTVQSRVRNKKQLLESQKNDQVSKLETLQDKTKNETSLNETTAQKSYEQKKDSGFESKSNFAKKPKINGILSLDFTREMTALGYIRGDIVTCITLLKKQNIWDESSLEVLIEKGQKLLKRSKNL